MSALDHRFTGGLSVTSIAQAQDTKPETGDMPMAEGHSMKGMEGMTPMMNMMSEMGPMMEACTEMMQTVTDHTTSTHGED